MSPARDVTPRVSLKSSGGSLRYVSRSFPDRTSEHPLSFQLAFLLEWENELSLAEQGNDGKSLCGVSVLASELRWVTHTRRDAGLMDDLPQFTYLEKLGSNYEG